MMEENTEKKAKDEIDEAIAELMESGQSGAPETKRRRRKPGKRIKRILIAAVLIGFPLFFLRTLFFAKSTVPYVETAALARGTIEESLSVTGPVEGSDSVDVTSNLHAKVTELLVKEGDRVEGGSTVLARLDTSELEKEVEVAQGNYDLAVAQRAEKLKSDNEAYKKAVQELNAAKEHYDRQAALAASGDVSKVELSAAENQLRSAEQTVKSFNVQNGTLAADASADIQIENAARLLEQAKDKIKEAEIIAPISGTVTRVNTKVGQFANDVENNKPMLTIENLDELQMVIRVSEYSIGKVHPGQEVRISADILEGKTASGKVLSISPTGEEKGGGSTERVIPTRISIIEKDTALIAGITARAQIVLKEAENVFVVPISAVGADESGNSAVQFVVKDEATGKKQIRTVQVETGIESDLEAELCAVSGEVDSSLLSEGGEYLVSYNPALSDGTEVQTGLTGGEGGAQHE